MKRNIFAVLLIGMLFFSFSAYADETTGIFVNALDEFAVSAEAIGSIDKEDFVGGIGFEDEDYEQNIEVFSEEDISDWKNLLTTPRDVIDDPSAQQRAEAEPPISDDDAIDLNSSREKTAPQPSLFQLMTGVDSLIGINGKTIKNVQPKTMGNMNTAGNTNPNDALFFPLNAAYEDTMDYTGDQAWFLTQTTSSGQLTFHVEVPRLNVDYDLYVYKYDADTGYLNLFKSSTNDPRRNEHTSFMAEAGQIYFFVVTSYNGSSTTPYTIYLGFNSQNLQYEVDDSTAEATVISNNTVITSVLGNICDEDYFRFTVTGNKTVVYIPPLDGVSQYIGARLYDVNRNPLNTNGYGVSDEDDPSTMIRKGEEVVMSLNPGTYYLKFTSTNKKVSPATAYKFHINNFNSPNNESIGKILTRTMDGSRIAYLTNANKLCVNSEVVRTGGISRTVRILRSGTYYQNGVTYLTEYQFDASDVSGSIPGNTPGSLDKVFFARYNSSLVTVSDVLAVKSEDSYFANAFRYRVKNTDPWKSQANNTRLDGFYIIDLRTGDTVDCYSNANGFYNGYFEQVNLYNSASLQPY